MVGDLIVSAVTVVGCILFIAWFSAVLIIGYVIWKYRDRSFEDDIEWDVEPYTGDYIKIKDAPNGK